MSPEMIADLVMKMFVTDQWLKKPDTFVFPVCGCEINSRSDPAPVFGLDIEGKITRFVMSSTCTIEGSEVCSDASDMHMHPEPSFYMLDTREVRLPQRPRYVHGRKAELDALQELQVQQHAHCIVLTGAEGVGKSTLALEYCHDIVREVCDPFCGPAHPHACMVYGTADNCRRSDPPPPPGTPFLHALQDPSSPLSLMGCSIQP